MNRKSKLFFSLVSLCFSIAVLCFGVYSALSVSYSISGSVSYEIQDVFVELDLSVYRALSTTPVNSATHNQNVSTIKDAGDNISETDFGKLSYTDHKSTYENGVVTNPGQEWSASSPDLDLTYGSPTGNETQGYAFYIVIDIHNLGSEIINAQITAPTSLENTILHDSGNVEITADGTERIVLGLALDDVTTGIISADFTYTITISRGELPLEEITDMVFSVDEATKTATLISYAGPGGDVVIPETIGYDTASSRTLTFNTMEDMTSNEMNMIYFYQDLYITLPNQEAQLIENPMLWLNKNMGSIQATPQNYFPMTIQTVDSYTIDQEDYDKYATLGQSEPMMATIIPIQMIIGGLLYNSVDVQYGTEGQSFTFNMENYNAAIGNDESTTSLAIQDFMLKMETDPESLLPVTYSNFEYGFAVKGEEYFVTSIGEDAFRDCSNLTRIEIPSSVTSIEVYAFGNCSALETVTFGANSQLENIGSSAFSDCSNLTSIEIPSGVTSIGGWVFSDCYALAEVYNYSEQIPEVTIGNSSSSTNGYLGQYAKVVYNPSDLQGEKPATRIQTIGNVQYYVYGEDFIALAPSVARDSLTTLTLDSRTTEINVNAFFDCDALTSIEIPSSVTSIGEDAFFSCSALETITFGANSQLESIGSSAFSRCSALETVTFGENSQLASIGSYAFSYCSNLTSIEIPSSVTSIGSYAFSDTPWLTNLQNTSYGIATASDGQTRFAIDVPTDITDDELDMTNVRVIAGGAFTGCSNLTRIEIPSSMTSIGDYAFRYCDALETVTFEDSDSVWVVNNSSNTEITISEHTPQELADYLKYNYYGYTWTKNV